MGRKVKAVYFNEEKEKDLLEYANNIENFSVWVKDQIRKNMQAKGKTGIDPEIKCFIEKLIDEKLAGLQLNDAEKQKSGTEKNCNDKSQVVKDIDDFF
jgi:DNA topoisomerase VI subunit B